MTFFYSIEFTKQYNMVQSIVMINNFENSHVFILQQNELYTMRILICCTNQNDRIHLTVTFVYHKDF